jgi:hypothetical protein
MPRRRHRPSSYHRSFDQCRPLFDVWRRRLKEIEAEHAAVEK